MLCKINHNIRYSEKPAVTHESLTVDNPSVELPEPDSDNSSEDQKKMESESSCESSESLSDSGRRIKEFEEKVLKQEEDKLLQMIEYNMPCKRFHQKQALCRMKKDFKSYKSSSD